MAYFGKILLFEDNRGDQRLIEEALNAVDFRGDLEVVGDGDDGLARLYNCVSTKIGLPDLVLLDLSLPKKNGKEILKIIKSHAVLKLLPVVIFTSSELPADVRECYALGATSYMVKRGGIEDYFASIAALVSFWFGVSTIPVLAEFE